MAVAYPAGLPIPKVSGYSNREFVGNSVVETEVGAPIIENKLSVRPTEFNVSWILNQEQFRVFEGYFKWELNFGRLTFDMNLSVAAGLVEHELLFTKPYKVSLNGKKWVVTATLIGFRNYGDEQDYLDAKESIIPPPEFAYGDYYWSMDEEELVSYNINSSNTLFEFGTPLNMQSGDYLEWSMYNTAQSISNGDRYLEDSTGLLLYVAELSGDLFDIVGCRVFIDDVEYFDGDSIPQDQYKPMVMRVESTVTCVVIGIAAGSSSRNGSYYQLSYSGVDGDFSWDLQTEDSPTQVENSLGVNNISIAGHVSSRWGNSRTLVDAISGERLYRHSDSPNLTEMSFRSESLREDGAGYSVGYDRDNGSGNGGHHEGELFIAYQNGFTVECIVKVDSISDRGATDGSIGFCLSPHQGNINSLWVMRFDNFDDTNDDDVYPCFTILERNSSYDRGTQDYNAAVITDLRGVNPLVIGDTHHLLATIRPSDNTCEFWVDGVSIGSGIIPSSWYDDNGDSNSNILDGTFPTRIAVGGAFFDGAIDRIADSKIDELKIHLLEADQAFATQQAKIFTG